MTEVINNTTLEELPKKLATLRMSKTMPVRVIIEEIPKTTKIKENQISSK